MGKKRSCRQLGKNENMMAARKVSVGLLGIFATAFIHTIQGQQQILVPNPFLNDPEDDAEFSRFLFRNRMCAPQMLSTRPEDGGDDGVCPRPFSALYEARSSNNRRRGSTNDSSSTTKPTKSRDPSEDQEVAYSRHQSPWNLVGSRQLPNFDNGGVIFHVHIPKTGGTTLRMNLREEKRIEIHFAKDKKRYQSTNDFVENAVRIGTEKKRIIFYEIHAMDTPSYWNLRNKLQRWRSTAKARNVPVFFFTVLRESLSYAVSHFNFFHVQEKNPSFPKANATEQNLIEYSLYNPQCQFLYKGERSMRAQKKDTQGIIKVNPEICDNVYESFFETLDWVGTTERLSNETIPLLTKLLNLSDSFVWSRRMETTKITNVTTINRTALSAPTMEAIHDLSELDTKMYGSALVDFPFEMWDLS